MFSSIKQTLEPIKQLFAPMHWEIVKKWVYVDNGTYFAIDYNNYETPIKLGPQPNIPNVFHTCFVQDEDTEDIIF